ncbi:hypothetical protein [Robinsoniella peoriensis]|uniref:hypothetical protein n=1 Tax=Robinsoniella peoriensis TaxID=180332 RepID=UPI0036305FB9
MTKNNTRRDMIVNSVLDAGAEDIKNIGVEATQAIIQEVKDWLIDKYNKKKSSVDAQAKLETLEKQIRLSNETVEIGMDKKEIAVMWAMRKLGYTEEQTQAVLELANEAYKPKK